MEAVKKSLSIWMVCLSFFSCQFLNDSFFGESIGLAQGAIDLSALLKKGEGVYSGTLGDNIEVDFGAVSLPESKTALLFVSLKGPGISEPRSYCFDADSHRLLKAFPFPLSFSFGNSDNGGKLFAYHHFIHIAPYFFRFSGKSLQSFSEREFEDRYPHTFAVFDLLQEEGTLPLQTFIPSPDSGRSRQIEFIYGVRCGDTLLPLMFRPAETDLGADGGEWVELTEAGSHSDCLQPDALAFNGLDDSVGGYRERYDFDFPLTYALLDNRRLFKALKDGDRVYCMQHDSLSFQTGSFTTLQNYTDARSHAPQEQLYVFFKYYRFGYQIQQKYAKAPSFSELKNLFPAYASHFFIQPPFETVLNEGRPSLRLESSSLSRFRYREKDFIAFFTTLKDPSGEGASDDRSYLFLFEWQNDVQQTFCPYLSTPVLEEPSFDLTSVSNGANNSTEFDFIKNHPFDLDFPLSFQEMASSSPRIKMIRFANDYVASEEGDRGRSRHNSFRVVKNYCVLNYAGFSSAFQSDADRFSKNGSYAEVLLIPLSFFLTSDYLPSDPFYAGSVSESVKRESFLYVNRPDSFLKGLTDTAFYFRDWGNSKYLFKGSIR